MWVVVALHCSVQPLKTWKPFSFHSQVKIVYLLSEPFFGWFTLSEISSLTTLKQCKTGIFYLKCLKRFDLGHGAVSHVTYTEHWLAWNLMGNVTDAQMLFFFYLRVVTRLHSPTYEFNKLMENTWQNMFPEPNRQALLHPPLQDAVPPHLEKLIFWQNVSHGNVLHDKTNLRKKWKK